MDVPTDTCLPEVDIVLVTFVLVTFAVAEAEAAPAASGDDDTDGSEVATDERPRRAAASCARHSAMALRAHFTAASSPPSSGAEVAEAVAVPAAATAPTGAGGAGVVHAASAPGWLAGLRAVASLVMRQLVGEDCPAVGWRGCSLGHGSAAA